ncbi:MAG TPA: hypothetical protein VHN17_11765 [Steroidobacteraceae bacterium]|jgi:hypothetical protein|nr:hypothetical protein [Steroidobacteraceae bacterium]
MADQQSLVIDRRRFIQTITGVLTGVLGALGPLSALAPRRAWALELHALSNAEAVDLLAVVRTIAPHDGLDDAAYALVVGALDADAASSSDTRELLAAGLAGLGPQFAAMPEGARVEQLRAIESGAFFQNVRLKTLLVLYNNPIAWEHFGYEGEAFSKGGYLLRGFNDLKWLPDVPAAASGPLPLA